MIHTGHVGFPGTSHHVTYRGCGYKLMFEDNTNRWRLRFKRKSSPLFEMI